MCNEEYKNRLGHQEFDQLKEFVTDFLFKFKDKHPFSKPEEGKTMDVFYRVIQFMKDFDLQPSDELRKEYEKSETTMNLNEIPTFEVLNEKIGMKRDIYDKLKKRYSSKPPFVYFFNPNIKVQTNTGIAYGYKCFRIGFLKKGEVDFK